jgi:methylenetetrahydrofolate reductase (NADPH)
MKWLKVKCDAGADFVITQLFYDMDAFEKWVKECRAAGRSHYMGCELMIGITIPIIPGVMPIQNFSSFRRLVKLTGCPVPDTIMRELEPISVSRPLFEHSVIRTNNSPTTPPSSDMVPS